MSDDSCTLMIRFIILLHLSNSNILQPFVKCNLQTLYSRIFGENMQVMWQLINNALLYYMQCVVCTLYVPPHFI